MPDFKPASSQGTPVFCSLEFRLPNRYVQYMSTKELAMETIKGLPDDASWQEIEARIHLLAEVNLGFEELQRGEGIDVADEVEFLNLARAKR